MEDVLNWIRPTTFDFQKQHLIGNHNPIYYSEAPGKFYWLKGSQGFPWDIQLYDQTYIYLWITEQNWNDPKTFKKFISKSWQGGGIPLMPRFITLGLPSVQVATSNSSFEIHSSCKDFIVSQLGGVRTQLDGPFSLDHGGDIGIQDTLIASYQWGNFNVREQFYLAKGFGLVKWTTSNLDYSSGMYTQKDFSIFNKIAVGGAPKPFFPCF